MILPTTPALKVMLTSLYTVAVPVFSLIRRKSIPKNTKFDLKWRKICLIEAIVGAIVGIFATILVITTYYIGYTPPKLMKYAAPILLFFSVLGIAAIDDAYAKAAKLIEGGTEDENN
jgi:hypothetical protein